MNVVLLAHTPNPERVVAAAAKLCYSNVSIDELVNGLTEGKSKEFVEMLAELGHESPTEHVNFTFAIEGVSRALLAQITRHRIASYSVQSQRYVRLDQFEYVCPLHVMENEKAREEFSKAMQAQAENYLRIAATLKDGHLAHLLEEGLSEKDANKKAEKLAIEDARFVLPNACTTKMIVTMNTRSLQNFFHHRLCTRAQWEIRELAEKMLNLVQEVAPALFSKSGPPCAFGACKEGKLSCGQTAEMRKKFAYKKD